MTCKNMSLVLLLLQALTMPSAALTFHRLQCSACTDWVASLFVQEGTLATKGFVLSNVLDHVCPLYIGPPRRACNVLRVFYGRMEQSHFFLYALLYCQDTFDCEYELPAASVEDRLGKSTPKCAGCFDFVLYLLESTIKKVEKRSLRSFSPFTKRKEETTISKWKTSTALKICKRYDDCPKSLQDPITIT